MSRITLVETDEPTVQAGEAKIYHDKTDGKSYIKTDTGKVEIGTTPDPGQSPIPAGDGSDAAWTSPDTGDYYFHTQVGQLFYYDGSNWLMPVAFILPTDTTHSGTDPSFTLTGGQACLTKTSTQNGLILRIHNTSTDEVETLGWLLTNVGHQPLYGDLYISEDTGVLFECRTMGTQETILLVDADTKTVTVAEMQVVKLGNGTNRWSLFDATAGTTTPDHYLEVTVNDSTYRIPAEKVT